MMRILTMAMTVLVGVAMALPAEAARKKHRVGATPVAQKVAPGGLPLGTFDVCRQRGLGIGLVEGQEGLHAYIVECMTGHPSGGGRTRE